MATKGKAGEIWTNILLPFLQSKPSLSSASLEDENISIAKSIFFTHPKKGNEAPKGVEVEWLNNSSLQICDAWSAIAFVMSIAATFDDADRTKDWYLELLLVFGILLRRISSSYPRKARVPKVIHILWTDKRQLFLQSFPDNTMLTSSDSQPPAPPIPGHGMGSMPPSSTEHWKKLKEYRKLDMANALRDADARNGTDTAEKFNDAMVHDPENLGQCAETIPYLCIMSGGVRPETQLYGLSFRPPRLDEPEATNILGGSNADASIALHFLHEFGFIRACQTCCTAMRVIGVGYNQYKRGTNGGTYLHKPSQYMLADEADAVV
ncbi:hypothetical protein M407DRAFT_7142 [Tulasnella calospora MUT 4182]|uniref:Uncharacterized protein n=1 Tax=Tulasnella calospora MUT 4182 TaxID=1051891 RepID=A0A0C3M1U6_9AGAM|nr:hypothetical protein M407DRAFT_7142 [Tulasnella calospora MUT 4182]